MHAKGVDHHGKEVAPEWFGRIANPAPQRGKEHGPGDG